MLQVLEWGGVPLTERSFEEVCAVLERGGDIVELLVEPAPQLDEPPAPPAMTQHHHHALYGMLPFTSLTFSTQDIFTKCSKLLPKFRIFTHSVLRKKSIYNFGTILKVLFLVYRFLLLSYSFNSTLLFISILNSFLLCFFQSSCSLQTLQYGSVLQQDLHLQIGLLKFYYLWSRSIICSETNYFWFTEPETDKSPSSPTRRKLPKTPV